jgi:hypothetical protein
MLNLPCIRLAIFMVLMGASPAPSVSEGIFGKYELAGTAHVSVSPLPAHDYSGEMTATVSRAPGAGALSLRLESRGYGCTLPVRADEEGSLQFPTGATCAIDIAESDAHGHVDAQLRMGRGRLVHGRLELVLQFDVTGSLQMRIPSKTIQVLGSELHTPATWAPSAPVHGTVGASGQGDRQAPTAR